MVHAQATNDLVRFRGQEELVMAVRVTITHLAQSHFRGTDERGNAGFKSIVVQTDSFNVLVPTAVGGHEFLRRDEVVPDFEVGPARHRNGTCMGRTTGTLER